MKMNNTVEIEIKVYLRNVRKPIILVTSDENKFDQISDQLDNGDRFIKVGKLRINTSDIVYIMENRK